MHYAILCYDSEELFSRWSAEQEQAELSKLAAVMEKLTQAGKLGPVARLMPTTAATTLRKGRKTQVLDGPFAETKEQLLGFYIVDCNSLEEAIEAARELGLASSTPGSYEIRPIADFRPNPGAS
jgi:hypothetical protein